MKLKTLYIFILFTGVSFSQSSHDDILDSITIYNEYANQKDFSIENKIKFTKRSHNLAKKTGIDSIILKTNNQLSKIYWNNNLNDLYKHVNIENLTLATRIKDSTVLTQAASNLGRLFYKINKSDSAFYYNNIALKLYQNLNDNYNTAVTLLRIAILQKNEKDFTGSEVNSIKAINLLDQLPQTNKIIQIKAFVYNNLGMVFDQLEQYDEAITYHNKAIEFKRQLKGDNKLTIDNSINNLALSYKNSKQYELAIKYYLELLEDNDLKTKRPNAYALILDHYAHTLYLSGKQSQLPKLYHKALKITNSVDSLGYNSIAIHQHLAEYYNDKQQKDSAKYYGYKAKAIAQRYHNDDLLKSLLILSKIEEGDKAVAHLNAYITLNDSIQKSQRNIRNKTARIEYETKYNTKAIQRENEQITQENVQITKERALLFLVSIVAILASLLLYIIVTQRTRNKALQYKQQQQEANEEIYNLMLSQNENIEEARMLEKKRISEELHDGILGRLFGVRLSLDSLNMSQAKEAIDTRGQYIEQLKDIEQDIRKVSHELNTDFVSGSGFVNIVKNLLDKQTRVYQLKYDFKHNEAINWDEVPNKTKIHLYRIIQETLNNIYKHANATQVNVNLELKDDKISLNLSDNGSGFNVNKAKTGIGLKNMNSRMKEINGKIKIASQVNIGTTVNIEAPILQ